MKFDEPMKAHTTFGIGGPASCLVYPDNHEELSTLLQYANKENIESFFTGSGSNLLVWDEGFDGFIISLRKTFKKLIITEDLRIISESGVMLGTLVKEAIRSNISGLESLIGVPGTIGGALIMNAGAYGSEISNYFEEAKTMTLDGYMKTYTKNDVCFSYRNSTFPEDEMRIEATFNCHKGVPERIQEDRIIASQGRKSNQPLRNRSAGSIFKNPSEKLAAGHLIDQAGLKGTQRGGACISKKHANFIINLGEATAEDVFYLIRLAKQKVSEEFDINLELEVKLVGFPQSMMNEIYYV